MSSGSDSDNDTLNTTDSNIEDGMYDPWMNGSSQTVQKFNMDACSALRKEKSPLQRLHSGVKKEVLHHRKISTFRPSPLDTSNTSTTSSRVSAAVKSYFDLTNSTGSKASNTKPIRSCFTYTVC